MFNLTDRIHIFDNKDDYIPGSCMKNPKDLRCAMKYLGYSMCDDKDCVYDETCESYIPMWFSDCSDVQAIEEIKRLEGIRKDERYKKLGEGTEPKD